MAVLEAGDEEDATPDVYLPYKFVDLVQSQADWAYYTVPQEHCCKGLQENVRNLKVFFTFYFIIPSAMLCVSVNIFMGVFSQRSIWPRGKVLGGSSSINALMWIRGSRHDYDLWSKLGATGWNYSEVLPYFIRSENNQDKERVKSGNK